MRQAKELRVSYANRFLVASYNLGVTSLSSVRPAAGERI